jgi:hypothetical protein
VDRSTAAGEIGCGNDTLDITSRASASVRPETPQTGFEFVVACHSHRLRQTGSPRAIMAHDG